MRASYIYIRPLLGPTECITASRINQISRPACYRFAPAAVVAPKEVRVEFQKRVVVLMTRRSFLFLSFQSRGNDVEYSTERSREEAPRWRRRWRGVCVEDRWPRMHLKPGHDAPKACLARTNNKATDKPTTFKHLVQTTVRNYSEHFDGPMKNV